LSDSPEGRRQSYKAGPCETSVRRNRAVSHVVARQNHLARTPSVGHRLNFLLLWLILPEPLIASPHSAGQPTHGGPRSRSLAGVARYGAANCAKRGTPRSASRNVTLWSQRSVRRRRRAGNSRLSSACIISGLRLALPGSRQKQCCERRDGECESNAIPVAA
jgi:hypothetical protein